MLAAKLKKGDKIAVFSPSSPATKIANERYERGKAFLKNKGFDIFEGCLTGKSDFYRSASIKERADELNFLIHNPTIKCIMSSIGGMNSNSILPYIDYEYLKSHPKIIIGYSDITAILLAIYAKTDLTTYYGPAIVASFGEFEPFVSETFSYFADIVLKGDVPHILPTPKFWTDEFIDWNTQDRGKKQYKNKLLTINGGKVTGRLIGGNLNTMQGFLNTEYFPEIKKGDILFIEDSLKDCATIERSFSLLKLSGVFNKIGGLIISKHELFDDMGTKRKPHEILMEVMGKVDFPVLAQFDCAHTHPMLTLPIGVNAMLDADKQRLTLIDNFIG